VNLAWDDALWAAAALSIDPCGLRGVWLRAPHGPVRDEWLAQLTRLHPALRRVPGHADSERLLGGLDLGATLHAGRAIYQPGVLTQPDPTLLLLPMAERLPDDTAAILGQVLDQGQVPAGRQQTARDTFIGLVALDESLEDEPPMAGGLQERLGIWLDLRHMGRAGGEDDNTRWMLDTLPSMDLSALRAHALHLDMEDAVVQAVCQTAHTLGVDSLRACLATVKLAKLLAALRGSDQVQEEDLGRAARLVLTPRATRAPVPPDQQAAPPEAEAQNDSPPDQPPPSDPPEQPPEPPGFDPQDMAELMLEAALATLPADVLALLADHKTAAPAGRGQGRSGNRKPSFLRGTPLPPRPGNPRQGARLHVLATLNAAVPRQKLRRLPSHSRAKLAIRTEDFHVHRYAEHSPTCLIFAIDASGSAAPLACAIEQCLQVALAEKRLGHSPSLVMLSDGRPNVSLQGQGGRAQALEDALTLAHVWRGHQLPAIWLDTSARPEPQAQQLAQAMGAHYVPLPMANSNRMAQAVQAVQSGNTPPATAIARAAWQPNAPSAQTPVWRNPGA